MFEFDIFCDVSPLSRQRDTRSCTLHSTGKPSAALLALAFLTHLFISTFLLLPPVLMLLVASPVSQLASPREFKGDLRTALKYAGQFVTYWLVLFGASSVMVGGDLGWVRETWGARFIFHDEV